MQTPRGCWKTQRSIFGKWQPFNASWLLQRLMAEILTTPFRNEGYLLCAQKCARTEYGEGAAQYHRAQRYRAAPGLESKRSA